MTLMVHFPWLHPALASPEAMPAAMLFDPGVEMHTSAARWRPENLPYAATEVRRLLREYFQFGERFARPSDMGYYQAHGMENSYTDSTMEMVSQLSGGRVGSDSDVAPGPDALLKQAQLLLAMALSREEQFVAMREQETRFEGARENFAAVLGLDDEETFADLSGPADEALFPRASVDLPWKLVLEPMSLFLPDDVALFVSDGGVLEALVSEGLEFQPCEIGGLACMSCTLDEDGLERVWGKRLARQGALRFVALPVNP